MTKKAISKRTNLLSLPLEIRSQIIEHAIGPFPKSISLLPDREWTRFATGEEDDSKCMQNLQRLMSINQQLRHEVAALVYRKTPLLIAADGMCMSRLSSNLAFRYYVKRIDVVVPVNPLISENCIIKCIPFFNGSLSLISQWHPQDFLKQLDEALPNLEECQITLIDSNGIGEIPQHFKQWKPEEFFQNECWRSGLSKTKLRLTGPASAALVDQAKFACRQNEGTVSPSQGTPAWINLMRQVAQLPNLRCWEIFMHTAVTAEAKPRDLADAVERLWFKGKNDLPQEEQVEVLPVLQVMLDLLDQNNSSCQHGIVGRNRWNHDGNLLMEPIESF